MFKSIFKSSTFKQSQITIAGTLLNGLLGALFYILLARFLGPSEFGLLAVSIATLTLIADVADLGTNTGLIRFVSSSFVSDKEQAFKYLKLSLEIKIVVWIIVLVIGWLLSPFIATSIFGKPELINPLRLVMIGVGGALLFTFSTSALQAFQKYLTWSVINIATNFLRLILILLIFASGQLNLENSLLAGIALPFFGFSMGLLFVQFKRIINSKNELSLAGEFFRFNGSIAIFTLIAAVSSRLDTFLNVRLLTTSEVGIYAAANQLVQIIPQLVGALGIVAAPKFASFQNKEQMLVYFKKFQLMVLGLAGIGVLMIPFATYIIPLLYGDSYVSTVLPFIILFMAMLIFLISIPLHNSIIFYFGKPKVFVWVALGHLIIIGLLGYFMISNYGVIGAAFTVLVGTLFNFIAPLLWFLRKIHEKS